MKKVIILLILVISFVLLLTNLTLADTQGDYRQLLAELRLDAALLAKFNLLFGLNLQPSGELSRQEFVMFMQVVTEKDYYKEKFLSALDKTANLLISLREDNSLLSAFNTLFATAIPSSGNPTPTQTKMLFDLTGDPNFNLNTFLVALPKTNKLYTTLNANQKTLTTFNEVFDTRLSPDSDLTKKDRATLFSLAATPGFNYAVFVDVLPKAKNLIDVIKTDKKAAEEFNNIFATQISGSTPLTAQNRGTIFDVVGTATFKQGDFLKVLPQANSLLETITSDNVTLENFNNIFETNISSQGEIPVSERGVLFDVAGTPKFNEENFVAVLPKAEGLLKVLEKNKEAAGNFNNLFNTNVDPDKKLVSKDRGILFDVTGDPKFNQESFLKVLPKTNALSQALEANKEIATTFDTLFNTTVASSDKMNTESRGRLFDVSGDPKFNQDKFLAALPGAKNLYRSIITNNDIANNFNQVFGTNISASSALAPTDRGILFDVSAAPGFNQDKFLEVLPKVANLLTLLRTNPQSVIDNFNRQFNADITKSDPLSGTSKKALFDIVGGPYYNASVFLQSLGDTTAEQDDPPFVPQLVRDSETTDRLFAPLTH